jgi:hypothetical protein
MALPILRRKRPALERELFTDVDTAILTFGSRSVAFVGGDEHPGDGVAIFADPQSSAAPLGRLSRPDPHIALTREGILEPSSLEAAAEDFYAVVIVRGPSIVWRRIC